MFSIGEIARFLGTSTKRVHQIMDQLKISHWYTRKYTEQEARAIMAQYYFRKGKGIAARGVEPRGKG